MKKLLELAKTWLRLAASKLPRYPLAVVVRVTPPRGAKGKVGDRINAELRHRLPIPLRLRLPGGWVYEVELWIARPAR